MSDDDNNWRVYRRYIEEFFNGNGVSAAADYVTDDFVGHWPTVDVQGPAGLDGVLVALRQQAREVEFTIELDPFGDGEWVAARWTGRGVSQDGKALAWVGNDIVRVNDGKIAEHWDSTVTLEGS